MNKIIQFAGANEDITSSCYSDAAQKLRKFSLFSQRSVALTDLTGSLDILGTYVVRVRMHTLKRPLELSIEGETGSMIPACLKTKERGWISASIVSATYPAVLDKADLGSVGKGIFAPQLSNQLGVAKGCLVRHFAFPSASLKLARRLVGNTDHAGCLSGLLHKDGSMNRCRIGWALTLILKQNLQKTFEWYRNAHP